MDKNDGKCATEATKCSTKSTVCCSGISFAVRQLKAIKIDSNNTKVVVTLNGLTLIILPLDNSLY